MIQSNCKLGIYSRNKNEYKWQTFATSLKKKYVGRFKESLPINLDLLYQELRGKKFYLTPEIINHTDIDVGKYSGNRNKTYIDVGKNTSWLSKCLKYKEKIEDYRILLGILYRDDQTIWGKWALYNIHTKKITLRSTVNEYYGVPKNRLLPTKQSGWYIHQTELCACHLFWKKLYDNLTLLKDVSSLF
uniref:Uncharacterized protein n=1 Tax=viral metagenome TaxID=1070528 RepID=A0A6C0M0M3_9ZZZZ